MAKRGLAVEGVHFHSFPYTSERAKEKVYELCRRLTPLVRRYPAPRSPIHRDTGRASTSSVPTRNWC